MEQMEIFKNPEFGSICVIEEEEKCLFCRTDVAVALGYAKPRNTINAHSRYSLKRGVPHSQSLGIVINMTFIPEGDVYRLIVHSKLPLAERFERWIFDEVLPSTHKYGVYITPEKLWEVATFPEALMKFCSDLLAERQENAASRNLNAVLQEKALYFDRFVQSGYCTNFCITAKELNVPKRRFVRFLLEQGYVYRSASGNVLPYNISENDGLFFVKDYYNNGLFGT